MASGLRTESLRSIEVFRGMHKGLAATRSVNQSASTVTLPARNSRVKSHHGLADRTSFRIEMPQSIKHATKTSRLLTVTPVQMPILHAHNYW